MTTLLRRWAWLVRTSTQDLQDPTLSLPRQLDSCRAILPAGVVIVAHFYDVESGLKDLDVRGHGQAHEAFDIPIPRDGGIADLLAEAGRADRRFDGVICESIERVARRTYYGTKVEYELERAGVRLLAADEPIVATGKRATTILTRRVNNPTTSSPSSTSSHCSPTGSRTYPRAATPALRQPPTPTHLPSQRQTIDVDITLADLTTDGELTDEAMSHVWLAPPAGFHTNGNGHDLQVSARRLIIEHSIRLGA